MRSLRLLPVLAFLLFVTSCASVGKLNTASTKPEVTIASASKKKVLDALVAWSATQGRQVIATTEYSITTSGQMDARNSGNILWDETSLAKTVYTPVIKNNEITIYSQRFITYAEDVTASQGYGNVNNNITLASARDKTEEYNSQRAYEEMQMELENFAQFFKSN